MTSPTQTTENATEVEYISIYDKPKRARGRPCGSKYSDEEKRQQSREANSRCYYKDHEHYSLQKQCCKRAKNDSKKCSLEKKCFRVA